ncbi:MAG TPA: hypothetical protein VNT01_08280 [Symbiobacteriaceae bacterium]|nr:hypothetical protein [Symbiobacteriaceae bacterium]
MRRPYVESVARFVLGLGLLSWLLWASAAGGSDLFRTGLSTLRTVGLAVLYALPVALLFGIPAGLWPGRWLDRALQTPVLLVAALPAVAVVDAVAGRTTPAVVLELCAALLAGPWLAKGIRDGIAAAREAPPDAAEILGRLLREFGNLAVATVPLQAAFGLSAVAPGALAGLVPVALTVHLAGDLLLAGRPERVRPEAAPDRSWLGMGGTLVFFALLTGPWPPWGYALAATAVAAVGGALLAGLGRVTGPVAATLLTPRVQLPMLLAPFLASQYAGVLHINLAVALGLVSIPAVGYALRRTAGVPAALALVLAQSLFGAMLAGGASVTLALGVGGLFLIGRALEQND